MPFVNVKLVDGVFTPEEKHAMAKAITDVMVKFEGSEASREVVWVLIEELYTDGWHIGGRPFEGPKCSWTRSASRRPFTRPSMGSRQLARNLPVPHPFVVRQSAWRAEDDK
jgi:4-oxalocrotonate tautomerase